jgi:ketosteroid isomerase-like protein
MTPAGNSRAASQQWVIGMNESGIELVQRYLQAVSTGDLDTAAVLLSADVRLEMPGAGSLAGHYVGREAFFAAFRRMMAVTQGTYKLVETTAWTSDKSTVVLLAVESAVRNGQTIRFRRAIAYKLSASTATRIATVDVYELDPQAAEQAFAAATE